MPQHERLALVHLGDACHPHLRHRRSPRVCRNAVFSQKVHKINAGNARCSALLALEIRSRGSVNWLRS
jgi:hypothetical protein